MANVTLPEILKKVASVMRTDDDSSDLDRVLSVGTLVFVAGLVTPLIHAVLPIVPGLVTLPLTAGLLHVVIERLA
jgi:hypothetical protein